MVLLAQALSAGGVDETNLDDAEMAELKLIQMTTGIVHKARRATISLLSARRRPKVTESSSKKFAVTDVVACSSSSPDMVHVAMASADMDSDVEMAAAQ